MTTATKTTLLASPSPAVPPPGGDTTLMPKKLVRARPLFDPEILRGALRESILKLNPVTLMKNPVIFVVEVGAALTALFLIRDIIVGARAIGHFPLLVIDSDAREVIADLAFFSQRFLFVRNSQDGHDQPPVSALGWIAEARTTTSIKNSKISTWRLASCSVAPQV